jgi:osmotically-inducible protein OsmY
MSFSFRLFRLSILLAGPLIALALHANADELQPPSMIIDASQQAAPSPTDPGTSSEDLRITQSVRAALANNHALSTDAQSVKVVTRAGAVTLLGQVKNAEEKSVVLLAVQRTAGVKRVDDQLAVKPQ